MLVHRDGVLGFVRHGKLAYELLCIKLELQVCHSANGYYIGTMDPESGPCSRESEEYFSSFADAQYALDHNKFIQRDKP